ncbi:hypothetical protein PIB30_072513, partial [Stylosanthes scabra]|nr:hypothetical protein [Stylosanthes scabra]
YTVIRSGVVFYEYKALKEYDDIDVEPIAELGMIKIRRYHFKDRSLPLRCIVIDLTVDRPYEIPIAMLGGDCSFGLSLRTYPPHDWKVAHTRFLPSLGSDETKVEETHRLDGAKSEGSKGKELVEEEEDPEEDPDKSQPMDTSAESDFLMFLMGDTKLIYSSSSSYPTIESQGSKPSSGYPTSSVSLQSGNLSGTWSSSDAPNQ